jgi:hypothetical protein
MKNQGPKPFFLKIFKSSLSRSNWYLLMVDEIWDLLPQLAWLELSPTLRPHT